MSKRVHRDYCGVWADSTVGLACHPPWNAQPLNPRAVPNTLARPHRPLRNFSSKRTQQVPVAHSLQVWRTPNDTRAALVAPDGAPRLSLSQKTHVSFSKSCFGEFGAQVISWRRQDFFRPFMRPQGFLV
ncbi:hypothetical protein CDAR_306891 [Caerostris darwini]|uniref:Uncharacterized protein n=1 Tax=Caerostris darwini TaxID=1538125 RepID=A0AAV4QYA9_9ARAC|nr:hypothetical protein CDAR_306891 [Caerostris darwini]